MIKLKKNNHVLKSFNVVADDISRFDKYIYSPKTIMIAEGLMFYLRKNEMLCFLENIGKFLCSQGGGYFIFDAMHWEDETFSIRSMRKNFVPLLRLENAPWHNSRITMTEETLWKRKDFVLPDLRKRGRRISIRGLSLNKPGAFMAPGP